MHKRFKRNKLTHVCRVFLKFWINSVMFFFYFYLIIIIGCWDCTSLNYDWQWINAMSSACDNVLEWPPSTPEVRCLIPIFTFYPSFHNELRVLFPELSGLLTCSMLYSSRGPNQVGEKDIKFVEQVRIFQKVGEVLLYISIEKNTCGH